jgi:hypothetical protein
VSITEVLESHSQPLSSEELHDLAQQLTEQQKEDCGNKEMQTTDLTDILSAIDMAALKLRDINRDWKHSSTVKRGIRTMLHPYYMLQKKKKKSKQLTFVLS